MSKRKANPASTVQATPAAHPAWCNANNCDTNGIHESTEQVLDATLGRITAFLGQDVDRPEDTHVILTADLFPDEGTCPDFMQMTLEQATQLRDTLNALIAMAKPNKRASSCWAAADAKTSKVTAVIR